MQINATKFETAAVNNCDGRMVIGRMRRTANVFFAHHSAINSQLLNSLVFHFQESDVQQEPELAQFFELTCAIRNAGEGFKM